jgi:hypothetical protein
MPPRAAEEHPMATDDEMLRCLRALARGEEGPDAKRASEMLKKKFGAKGSPENARDALEAMGEPVVDPDEDRRSQVQARMGAARSKGIHWEGRDRVFPVTMTFEQKVANLRPRALAGDVEADAILARIRGRR